MVGAFRENVGFKIGQQIWKFIPKYTGPWVDPGRDGWKTFEGRTGCILNVMTIESTNKSV